MSTPLEEERRHERRKQLRKRGVTLEVYASMVIERCGTCDICGQQRKLHVDHDHGSGRVRGLLCITCNTKLGWYEAQRHAILHYLGK